MFIYMWMELCPLFGIIFGVPQGSIGPHCYTNDLPGLYSRQHLSWSPTEEDFVALLTTAHTVSLAKTGIFWKINWMNDKYNIYMVQYAIIQFDRWKSGNIDVFSFALNRILLQATSSNIIKSARILCWKNKWFSFFERFFHQ